MALKVRVLTSNVALSWPCVHCGELHYALFMHSWDGIIVPIGFKKLQNPYFAQHCMAISLSLATLSCIKNIACKGHK